MIELTATEMATARLLVLEGLSNDMLAQRRGSNIQTIKSQIKRILSKTDSIDRTQFVVRVWSCQVVIGDKNGHLEL